jgi:hypothetical protein
VPECVIGGLCSRHGFHRWREGVGGRQHAISRPQVAARPWRGCDVRGWLGGCAFAAARGRNTRCCGHNTPKCGKLTAAKPISSRELQSTRGAAVRRPAGSHGRQFHSREAK